MKFGIARILASVAIAISGGSIAFADIIFSDDFNRGDGTPLNTDSLYTVVNDGTPDGTIQFGFQYAETIPVAPRTTDGTRRALRMTVNNTVVPPSTTNGLPDTVTIFRNDIVTAPFYRMTVDLYMGFGLSGTAAVSGATEHAHIGVGGNGTTINRYTATGGAAPFPQSGSGSYIALTGDGGGASDYRIFRDASITPSGGATGTLPTTDPIHTNRNADAQLPAAPAANFWRDTLFPTTRVLGAPSIAGSPGNIWTTLTVDVNGENIIYAFDGIETFRVPYVGSMEGRVSLGLADIFASVDGGTVFTMYDNLEVRSITAVPEPSTFALLLPVAAGAWMVRRRRAAKVA